MFRSSIHLTGKDTDQELHRVYSLAHKNTESGMKKAMEPGICPACQTISTLVMNYYGICGHELT